MQFLNFISFRREIKQYQICGYENYAAKSYNSINTLATEWVVAYYACIGNAIPRLRVEAVHDTGDAVTCYGHFGTSRPVRRAQGECQTTQFGWQIWTLNCK